MAYLILPDRHRRPLLVPPQIDWGNPIARDLAFYYNLTNNVASGWTCIGEHVRPFTGGVSVPSQIGFGGKSTSTTYPIIATGTMPKFASTRHSMFAFATCESTSVTQCIIDDDDQYVASGRRFQFRIAAAQAQYIPFDNSGSGTAFISPAFTPMTLGELRRGFTMGSSVNGPTNSARLFQNRSKVTFTATNVIAPIGNVWIGARKAQNTTYQSGVIKVVAGWGRDLMDDEHLSMNTDPYQLERYPSRLILSMPDIAFTPRRALIMAGGQIQEVVDALVGTNQKPLVLYLGQVRQRVASEGVPLILVNGTIRTLAANEQLVV